MSWIQLVLLGLQLVNKLTDWALEKSAINEGERREIARQSADILKKVGVRDEIVARIRDLSDSDLDLELRGLEGTDGSRPGSS